jgi:uncharacterized membrane protein
MKILKEITIDADQQTVWRCFDDPAMTREWQPALKSQELIQGTLGEPGSVLELIYDHNGRELCVVSTVTGKREPEFMAVTSDSESSLTSIANRFEVLADNRTRWVLDMDYRFKGFYRLAALFLRKSMDARADEEMRRFKRLVETAPKGMQQ